MLCIYFYIAEGFGVFFEDSDALINRSWAFSSNGYQQFDRAFSGCEMAAIGSTIRGMLEIKAWWHDIAIMHGIVTVVPGAANDQQSQNYESFHAGICSWTELTLGIQMINN